MIELGNSGGVARIASFIVVGLLLLVVGYFAPYRQRIKLQQQKIGDRLESKERSFFREKIQKQSRDFWRFSVISHGCENPTRTWCFLSANFRLLDYNLMNFVFFKRVIIEC